MAERAVPQANTQEREHAVKGEPQHDLAQRQPEPGMAGLLLNMQGSYGNRYVQRMLRGAMIQRSCSCGGTCETCQSNRTELDRKAATQTETSNTPFVMREALHSHEAVIGQPALKISQPGDVHEQEADRVADAVVRTPDTTSIHASEESSAGHEGINHEWLAQRKEAQGGSQTTESFSGANLSHTSSGGTPLEPQTRSFMEERMGYDFGHVRVHRSSEAAESAKSINALAYTIGSDIVFGAGQYAPETQAGRRLLAHELTHVAQQNSHLHPSLIQRQAPAGPAPAGPAPAPTPPAPAPPGPAPAPAPAPGGGLTAPMLEQIARRLREAMDGPGTDEDAIYSAFAGRTKEQVDAITQTYERLYPGRNLQEDLKSELNDDELQRLALFDPTNTNAGTPADQIAKQLDDAMDRVGTDESSIFAALTGRTATELTNIKAAYKTLTQRELEADLRSELSGAEWIEALRLLNQGVLAPEDEIYLAIEGLGTDEDRIFRVVDSLKNNNAAIQDLDTNYRIKYGDLIGDLRGDLSGDDYERVRAVLAPVLQDVAFEDCSQAQIMDMRNIVKEAISKVDNAIQVLGKGWGKMSNTEQANFNKYFDPSASGSVDAGFVGEVLVNFRSILSELSKGYTIECETNTDSTCPTAKAYTMGANIHVCPLIFLEPQNSRVKTIIHETTHNALDALDRAYYWDTAGYQKMTPRGPWPGRIPLIGPVINALVRRDTINAPDAYACFACTMGGLTVPGLCDP